MRGVARIAGVTVALALCLAGAGAGAVAPPRVSDTWHTALVTSVASGPGSFGAVVALTPTSAWAFEDTTSTTTPIVAWRQRGATWTRVAFPEDDGDYVVQATRASASRVYVATSRGAILTWSGTQWAPVTTFVAITSIDATGTGDLWVTGRRTASSASGGLWHLDHGAWVHASTRSYGTIDAATDTAIFSVTNSSVEEFDGTRWVGTSLEALLPAKAPLCQVPGLTSVDALTPTDVWVTAAGNCQDFAGPFRLLHLVRSRWSIAAERDVAQGVAYAARDGSLWIPTTAFACESCSVMLHLAAGALTEVPLPIASGITVDDVSTPPGSTTSLAVGWTLKCVDFVCNSQHKRGVILRYEV